MAIVTGQGIVPAAGATTNELTAVTRRAFVDRLFVQMYYATPSTYYLFGNAQKAAGGLNQITIPMQGQSMVAGQYLGYLGGFNPPQVINAVQNGQWNISVWGVPVPLPFGETVIQSTEVILPLLKARMNDVYAVTMQEVATRMYANNSANPLAPNSFQDAFDNGTNFPTYGGINRLAAGNTNFKGQYINLGASPWNAASPAGFASGATRQAMASLLAYITDQAGGESPTYGVMNPSDYATLNAAFIGIEQAFIDPGKGYSMDTPMRSSFPNLNVSGVPIFADHFVPKGSMFFNNMKYTNMYLSEDMAFDFSGFQSLVPINQIGQQGIMVLGWNIVSAKSSSGAWCYGLPGGAW